MSVAPSPKPDGSYCRCNVKKQVTKLVIIVFMTYFSSDLLGIFEVQIEIWCWILHSVLNVELTQNKLWTTMEIHDTEK